MKANQQLRQTRRFSGEEIAAARVNIIRAFGLLGLVDDEGNAVCPDCGKSGRNRIRFFPNGGFQCYSAEWCNRGNNIAVDLLVQAGWSFSDAVSALLGEEHNHPDVAEKNLVAGINSFRAVVDSEVYEAVIALGDAEEAVRYFSRWHIDSESVGRLGTSVICDHRAFRQSLLSEFGSERLANAGVLRPSEGERREYWVINENYPVLEPHRALDGRVVGLQARASVRREQQYLKHKAFQEQLKAAELRGETFREPNSDERYVAKFSSLRGGGKSHLVGGGADQLRGLADGTTVYIVEGIKDLLAMWTLGFAAYALPGAGATPPNEVMSELARFNIALTFDADAGGDAGTDRLSAAMATRGIILNDLGNPWVRDDTMTFHDIVMVGAAELGVTDPQQMLETATRRKRAGLRCWRKRPPHGHDVCDVLVSKWANAGCSCGECVRYMQRSVESEN